MRLQAHAINLISTLSPAQAGITAMFSLVKPTGTVNKSIITDPEGKATAQFSLNRSKDRPGTYTGRVSLLVSGKQFTEQTQIAVK